MSDRMRHNPGVRPRPVLDKDELDSVVGDHVIPPLTIDRWNEEKGRPRNSERFLDDPADFEPLED